MGVAITKGRGEPKVTRHELLDAIQPVEESLRTRQIKKQ